MIWNLLLPWFPIVLGVGLGGRLLGRSRGFALGLLCTLFWILLAQSMLGVGIWNEFQNVAAILVGGAAIVAMGGWAGELGMMFRDLRIKEDLAEERAAMEMGEADKLAMSPLLALVDAMEQFEEWLEAHGQEPNPWPKFDDFVRSTIHRCSGAAHIKPYRLNADGTHLEPLNEPDPMDDTPQLPARDGIVGHVATTGRSYVEGDPEQGKLVEQLASNSSDRPAWCFAISQGSRRLGVVTARRFNQDPQALLPVLHMVERVIARFWCELEMTTRWRHASLDDAVSGLYTRESFLKVADLALGDSYKHGEPSAVAVLAVEGLRELNDTGRWETADELVRSLSRVLKSKVREDDRLGRFDGSRFAILLRRVDTGLASLIIKQLMARIEVVCNDVTRWGTKIRVRCGVVGSGTEQLDLRTLVSRAIAHNHLARQEDVSIISDVGEFSSETAGSGKQSSGLPAVPQPAVPQPAVPQPSGPAGVGAAGAHADPSALSDVPSGRSVEPSAISDVPSGAPVHPANLSDVPSGAPSEVPKGKKPQSSSSGGVTKLPGTPEVREAST